MTPEWMMFARAFFALLFVTGLIFLCAFIARKMGLDQKITGSRKVQRQLEVVESLYLDPKHRVVIVRSGENEHLLLLGQGSDVLIESKKRAGS